METPFVFGKIAVDKNFTDREKECEQLVFNFSSGVNTMLVSPRRWGKSSLVRKAASIAAERDKSIRFCFVDLYNIRSEEQFYQALAHEVLKASLNRVEDVLSTTKNFLGKLLPRISFSPDSVSDFSLSLDWKEALKQPDEILELAENISNEKNLKFVICIDEFQNLAEFGDSLDMQKKLRSHWQNHQKTAYCLYGSKRHMLLEVFSSPSMPFYKFGDLVFLEKISKIDWIPFIVNRFKETGKVIFEQQAAEIAELAEMHPYYVQQLAQLTWFRTNQACSSEIIQEAHESLILQLSLLFQTLTDELSNLQVNFLRAVLEGAGQLYSQAIIRDYDLGSSANIARLKQTLVKKEILEFQGSQAVFLDPMYKQWLKKSFFRLV